MIGIYKFTNKINNKVYIGQSRNINKRIKEHFYKANLESGQDYFSLLHIAIRKYGEENFDVEILEECSTDSLDERERYYITLYNCITPNGYNVMSGGQEYRAFVPIYCIKCGTVIDKNNTTQMCRKCYDKYRRRNIPTQDELYNKLISYKGNFSQVGRDYNVSSTAVVKWCKNYNMPYHSTDYKPTIVKKPNKIAVNQLDKNTGEILATFESANAAAKALGKKKGSHITEVCKGIHLTAYGYKWEYAK